MKNKELIKLRVDHDLTQTDMAKICGVSISTYNLIENGKRRGSKKVWQTIQAHFNLDGEQIWKLQNPEI
jgi:DNA-binding XRE family transcriptional regulator